MPQEKTYLIITSGQDEGRHFPIKDEVYIGRSDDAICLQGNILLLQDEKVSRRHIHVVRRGSTFQIQDLNSTNGTQLESTQLAPGVLYSLNNQDEFQIGFTRLRFVNGDRKVNTEDPIQQEHKQAGEGSELPASPSNISAILDASQLISGLYEQPKNILDGEEEMLRRLSAMAQVSISLGETKDRDALLAKIADCLFEVFPSAERANIFLQDPESKEIVPVYSGYPDGRIDDSDNLGISSSIFNEVIRLKHSLLLLDALDDARFKSQQSVVGLSLRSVMCVPLLYKEDILGMIQLDTQHGSCDFSKEDLHILTGIAAQVAIAVKNSRLFSEIERLFEGFVTASVQVIEARDPITAGHSFRVADYTEQLICAIDQTDKDEFRNVNFSYEQVREIRYAALLHDVGKIGVREHVLTKDNKLYNYEIDLLKQRFKYAYACMESQAYSDLIRYHEKEGLLIDEFKRRHKQLQKKLAGEKQRLDTFMETLLDANGQTNIDDEVLVKLKEILDYRFKGIEDEEVSLLSRFEFSAYGLAQGNLNPEERAEIESHVSHTFAFLRLIPWTDQLAQVPDIAFAHHEKLDGSGYPRGLSGEEIPIQSKMMTIADIYDAITSGDRPYRFGLTAGKALDLLRDEAQCGRIDAGLLNIFIESKSYQPKSPQPKH